MSKTLESLFKIGGDLGLKAEVPRECGREAKTRGEGQRQRQELTERQRREERAARQEELAELE